jgi:hypothetical protein
MSPHFVTPYRKSQKHDGNYADAICEAVGRPSIRFRAARVPPLLLLGDTLAHTWLKGARGKYSMKYLPKIEKAGPEMMANRSEPASSEPACNTGPS